MLKKIQSRIPEVFGIIIIISYFLSVPIGICVAIYQDSWANALLSLLIPFYGSIYGVWSIF